MTHEIGMMRCAVCHHDTAQPIELRRWDGELDDQIEAQVCSGDCAKAWIDGEVTLAADETDEAADEVALPRPSWRHDVEVAPGKRIRVRVYSEVDPATDAEMAAAIEMRTKVAYAGYIALLAGRRAEASAEAEQAAEGEAQS